VVLMSSLAATLGGLGMSAYAAANAFMDGLVEAPWRWPLRGDWYAIGWDGLAAEPTSDDAFGAEHVLALIEALVANQAPGLYLASRRDLNQRWFRWGARTFVEAPPSMERDPARGDYVSPANDMERIVADAFETLIGIRPIGATDDFFDLGGDSLLATQLCSRLRQRCQVDLAISAIFEHPVVEKLAAHIIALQGAATIGDDEVLALVRSLDSLDEAALAELLAE
jgi:acyl carrier protein